MSNQGPQISKKRKKIWRRQPKTWVLDFFGENIRKEFKALAGFDPQTETGLSAQQEEALQDLGDLVRAKLAKRRGESLDEVEQELEKKIGMSIMSGQGLGKDFFGALVMHWFMTCFPFPKNMATATSGKQLRNVFWSEMNKIRRLSRRVNPDDPTSETMLEQLFEYGAEKIYMKYLPNGKKNKGDEWFLEAVTINTKATVEEQGEGLAGRHEKFMLILADEASGIQEGVFKPLEGTLTGVINIVLCIFNPTRSKGYAIETQKEGSPYIRKHWNGEESEVANKNIHEVLAKKYGKDSNPYRIRVQGLPPLTDSDTLIPWDWIEDAVEREIEPAEEDPIIQGVDVGAGGDKSVNCFNHGGRVAPLERLNSVDTMKVAMWSGQNFDNVGATAGMVDNIGIGKGVFDRMRELRYRVYAADSRGRAREPERFFNARSEMYWTLREAFENGSISIPDDPELKNQLGAIRYEEEGRIQIWKKSRLKKELEGGSPDEADSLAMTYYLPHQMFRRAAANDKRDAYDEDDTASADDSWMAV